MTWDWLYRKTTWAVSLTIFQGILSEGLFTDMPGVQRWLRVGVIVSGALAVAFAASRVTSESEKTRKTVVEEGTKKE